MIPKAGSGADVHLVATLLTQIEDAMRLPGRIAICVLIETAAGMVNCEEIARACPERMEAMVFGVADYAASIQSHTTSIGGTNPDYGMLGDPDPDGDGERDLHLGDQWHYALSRIAVTCRANGLRPIDGPFGDFTDPEGYLASARRAAVLGYEGKWAIHPSQIELANEVFTPGEGTVDKTRRILEAMQEAAAQGKGAASLDGRLIDAASIRMAENLLAQLEQIEARATSAGRAPPVAAARPGDARSASASAAAASPAGLGQESLDQRRFIARPRDRDELGIGGPRQRPVGDALEPQPGNRGGYGGEADPGRDQPDDRRHLRRVLDDVRQAAGRRQAAGQQVVKARRLVAREQDKRLGRQAAQRDPAAFRQRVLGRDRGDRALAHHDLGRQRFVDVDRGTDESDVDQAAGQRPQLLECRALVEL